MTCMWDVHNTTRYNTNDIIAIFEGFEAWARSAGSEVQPDRGREQGTVRLVDYSPMRDSYSRLVITPSGPVQETLRVYVRGPSPFVRHLRDVGLVKPSRLYANPVEALAAPRVEGRETVPPGFVRQFITDAVSSCYITDPILRPDVDGFPYERFSIRIEPRRAATKVNRSNRPSQLTALQADHVELKWRMQMLEQALTNVKEMLVGMEGKLEAVSITPELTAESLTQAMIEPFALLEKARAEDAATILREMQ